MKIKITLHPSWTFTIAATFFFVISFLLASRKKHSNCQACVEVDEINDMVCCDRCQKWTHFCCAGVQSNIKRKEWFCTRCTGKSFCQKSISKRSAHTLSFLSKMSSQSKKSKTKIPVLVKGKSSEAKDRSTDGYIWRF